MFWPLQSSFEFLGVAEDSKFPLSGMWVSSSHLAQSEIATLMSANDHGYLSKKGIYEDYVGDARHYIRLYGAD